MTTQHPPRRFVPMSQFATDYTMLTGSDKTDQMRGIKRAKQILVAMRGK